MTEDEARSVLAEHGWRQTRAGSWLCSLGYAGDENLIPMRPLDADPCSAVQLLETLRRDGWMAA